MKGLSWRIFFLINLSTRRQMKSWESGRFSFNVPYKKVYLCINIKGKVEKSWLEFPERFRIQGTNVNHAHKCLEGDLSKFLSPNLPNFFIKKWPPYLLFPVKFDPPNHLSTHFQGIEFSSFPLHLPLNVVFLLFQIKQSLYSMIIHIKRVVFRG